jgi:hypothetical protein
MDAIRPLTGFDHTILNKYVSKKMAIERFQAKPVIIDAIKWTGDNFEEIKRFCNGLAFVENNHLFIETTEGTSRASVGDYIARGTMGEFYPIKPRVMKEKYSNITCPVEGCFNYPDCEHVVDAN